MALIVAACKAGLDPGEEHGDWPRVDSIPFASENRYMATLNHDHQGNHVIYVKGAPEQLLESRPLDAEAWLRCVAVGLGLFVLVEIGKFVRRKRSADGAASGGL